jgi:hypothetical protein
LEKYSRFGIAALTFADKKLSSGSSTNFIFSTLFENRMLTRIFGPKRDEVAGEWRKLHMRPLMICTPHPVLSW